MSIQGPSNPLLAGNSYTLTCVATADITPVVRWTDPSGNSVEGSEGLTVSGPFVSGGTTTLNLTFSYLRTSQAGTYSCLSIIDTPTSVQRDVRDVTVQSELAIATSVYLIWCMQYLPIVMSPQPTMCIRTMFSMWYTCHVRRSS